MNKKTRFAAAGALVALSTAASAQGWRHPGFGKAAVVVGSEIFISSNPGRWEPRGGKVTIFGKGPDGVWRETAAIDPAVRVADQFGVTMAATKDWLAVGAPGTEGGGAVYLYRRQGALWSLATKVTRPEAQPNDSFGMVVAIADDYLIVADPRIDSSRGAVFAAKLTKQGAGSLSIVAKGSEPGERFGRLLAADGDRLVIGASGRPRTATADSWVGDPHPGKVHVYRESGGRWTSQGSAALESDSVFGFPTAIALVGDEVWASATQGDSGRGIVGRWTRSGDDRWKLVETIKSNPPTTPQDGWYWSGMGSSIHSLGKQVVVGANNGTLYFFDRDGDQWRARPPQRGANNAGLGNPLTVGSHVMALGGLYGVSDVKILEKGDTGWAVTSTVTATLYETPAITGSERKCENGKVGDFDCRNVDLLSFLPISAIGGDRTVHLNDIWGWTDPETQREYALVGRSNGTSFVDVTDPSNPIYLGDLPMTAGARAAVWRDIKVYKDHAFIVSDGAGQHGMQVFDLHRLRDVAQTPTTFTADTVYSRMASAHNIVIDTESGYAYTVGNGGGGEPCEGALHMVDIKEPKNPKFAGCYAVKGPEGRGSYIHDAVCFVYRGPDTTYTGRQVCVNSSGSSIGIVDVTDKSNPVTIAVAKYPTSSYIHQGWLSEDHRYFFLDDELDEGGQHAPRTRTLIWDFKNLDDPVLIKEHLGETGATDHNLYIRGNLLYLANYVAGLRIIDVSDPMNPVEVGFFDTVPWGPNSPGFDGAWSNYPYFKSGTIIVSSMGQGLFVLKKREERAVQ